MPHIPFSQQYPHPKYLFFISWRQLCDPNNDSNHEEWREYVHEGGGGGGGGREMREIERGYIYRKIERDRDRESEERDLERYIERNGDR